MTHENTWRDGIRYFMTTNLNACATLQNQGRDYQNIVLDVFRWTWTILFSYTTLFYQVPSTNMLIPTFGRHLLKFWVEIKK